MNFMSKTLLLSIALVTAGISTAQDALPSMEDVTGLGNGDFEFILKYYSCIRHWQNFRDLESQEALEAKETCKETIALMEKRIQENMALHGDILEYGKNRTGKSEFAQNLAQELATVIEQNISENAGKELAKLEESAQKQQPEEIVEK